MSRPAPEPPDGPPVLRRASAKTKPSDGTPAAPVPPASAPAAAAPPAAEPEDSDRPVLKRPVPEAAPAAPTPSPEVSEEADPDRPVLKRGAPTAEDLKKRNAASLASTAGKKVTKSSIPAASASVTSAAQFIPAISDAAGPDPRPYAYSLKADEEQKLRKKILALAADEVRDWAAQPESVQAQPKARSHSRTKVKPPEPSFEDVKLRAFDLSNSNEPILVLTAKARMPVRPNTTSDLQYIITLVARQDMYGELHKAFASVTDSRHFDVLSRLELIDAVDADGDGRGELLFRQVSDAGSAFVLYRVIGDQLWPLFQGTPGE